MRCVALAISHIACVGMCFWLLLERERAQALYTLLWQAHPGPTNNFYCNTNLVSATGIQQGDPFGPSLSSLGIDNITRGLETEFNGWYLDNGTLGDLPEKVLAVVTKLVEDLQGLEFELNPKKCELTILNHNKD